MNLRTCSKTSRAAVEAIIQGFGQQVRNDLVTQHSWVRCSHPRTLALTTTTHDAGGIPPRRRRVLTRRTHRALLDPSAHITQRVLTSHSAVNTCEALESTALSN